MAVGIGRQIVPLCKIDVCEREEVVALVGATEASSQGSFHAAEFHRVLSAESGCVVGVLQDKRLNFLGGTSQDTATYVCVTQAGFLLVTQVAEPILVDVGKTEDVALNRDLEKPVCWNQTDLERFPLWFRFAGLQTG